MTIPLELWHSWWKNNGSRELRDLLMLWWDPIGSYGVPEATDEYDGYDGQVARRLREGASADDLAAYFASVMPEIGLAVSPDRDLVAATHVLEWYRRSMTRMEERVEQPPQAAT